MLESVILKGRLTFFGENRRSSNLKIARDSEGQLLKDLHHVDLKKADVHDAEQEILAKH